jgi:AraC family transcriptional regulator
LIRTVQIHEADMMFEKLSRNDDFPTTDITLQPHSLSATDDKVVLVDFQRRTNSTERALAPAPGAASPATTDGTLAIIARLLDVAGVALERDRRTARACIARAAALVRAERDRDSSTHPKGALAAWQVKRLTAFIDANLSCNIATEDLTDLTQMSTGHFFRSFKRSFGEPPFSFIARRRMLHAQELMLTTDEPLCQIALACGLCDQSHFTRVFRRVVGESPNAWRRRVTSAHS